MTTKNTLLLTIVTLFVSSLALAQESPKILADSTKPSVEVKKMNDSKDDRIRTLFSNQKNPMKTVKYLGLSVGSEFQYGSLAGEFTPMAGVSGTLHINKKWGIGLAGYSTVNNFTPTALNAKSLLNLNVMYGGLKLEYTPNPNAPIHVSFPLLIGGGMARVDSASNYRDNFGGFGGRDRDRNGSREINGRGTDFWVIQPGINIEANVIRFLKIYAGASYRLTPSVNTETITALPTPTANQLSGLNVSAGLKLGLFDCQLHRERKAKKEGFKREGRRGFRIF
jgi:hypothetical protein